MLKLLPLFCFLAVGTCDSSVLNAILDFMLESNRGDMVKRQTASAPIADLEHDFTVSGKYVNMSGELSCMQGWVKDFSTLMRVGNVSVTVEKERFRVSADLVLGKLQFGFRHCRLRLHPVVSSVTGQLSASVRHHAIRARASLTANKEKLCSPVLDDLTLQEVDGVDIDRTEGLFNMAISQIDAEIIEKCKDNVVKAARDNLELILRSAVSSLTFCPKAVETTLQCRGKSEN